MGYKNVNTGTSQRLAPVGEVKKIEELKDKKL